MLEFLDAVTDPLKSLSEIGFGTLLLAIATNILQFIGSVTTFLGTPLDGSNQPPIVESVTVADAPYGPAVDPIAVNVGGTRVYLHGTVRDPDGCTELDSSQSISAVVFPAQIGNCTGVLCVRVPYASSDVTVDECVPDGLTARYQVELLLHPLPIPASATPMLQLPWNMEVTARDRWGRTAANHEQVTLIHPGNATLPVPSDAPSDDPGITPLPPTLTPVATGSPTVPPTPDPFQSGKPSPDGSVSSGPILNE